MSILKSQFSILDHLEQLTPAKEKGKYICPVCADDNLSINHRTGAYGCMSNQCEPKLIRDAIAPLTPEAKAKYRQEKARPKTEKEKKRDATLAAVEVEMEAHRLLPWSRLPLGLKSMDTMFMPLSSS
jgi:ribosomal protein L37AE/L43A